jgi:hypothetical protein
LTSGRRGRAGVSGGLVILPFEAGRSRAACAAPFWTVLSASIYHVAAISSFSQGRAVVLKTFGNTGGLARPLRLPQASSMPSQYAVLSPFCESF